MALTPGQPTRKVEKQLLREQMAQEITLQSPQSAWTLQPISCGPCPSPYSELFAFITPSYKAPSFDGCLQLLDEVPA